MFLLVFLLVTTSTLNSVENRIPDVNNLVKKTDFGARKLDIESKYITRADYS